MKTKSILKLIQKRGVAIITAGVITLTTLAFGNVTTYAETIKSAQESVEKGTKDFNNGAYFQNQLGYRIKVSADDTAVKVYGCDLSKTLSDKSTVCLKGNNLTKYDTKGNLQWKKELDSTVCYSTPTYNNLLVDSKDNIIVLGYYGVTTGIYAVYDVNGNRTDYKYGMYVPVPVYRDSVTFDENENLIYQKAPKTSAGSREDECYGGDDLVNIYYVYDRHLYKYTTAQLVDDAVDYKYYGYWYHNSRVIATTDGGRIIVGNARDEKSQWSGNHYPHLIKVNSSNKVVFCNTYSNMKGSKNARTYGLYPNIYKTSDGGLIVRNKPDGMYYKIDGTTGIETRIRVYGNLSGFKSVNGVDYMYGKIGKSALGDMASNISSTAVNYVVPLGQDLNNGLYFNSNFGRIKDLTSDADGNLEVIFSCSSNEILDGLDSVQGETSKIISATLTK